jgi:hypothetical protein
LPSERAAALAYAQGLGGDADSVIELKEGENDDDEMFWMILGDKDYAQAQHWKWRPTAEQPDPRIWKVENGIRPVPFLEEELAVEQQVLIVDCIWELFVLVGSEARGRRQEIRLALAVTMVSASIISMSFTHCLPTRVCQSEPPAQNLLLRLFTY